MGIEEECDNLHKFIGPPLKYSFTTFYGFNEEDCAKAVKIYREYYGRTGLFENKAYEGIDKILEEAGFELRLPSCSSCLAMNPDKVPAGKLSISTSNRNFVGRQGPGARTVLASPLVVAASAITGVITDPRKI